MRRKIPHEEQLLKELADLHKRIILSPNYPPPNNGKRLTGKIIDELKTAQQYLDFVGVIIVILGADQKLTFMNKKGYDILGYTSREAVGKNWFDTFIPVRMREKVKAAFNDLMAGKIKEVEYLENPVLTGSGEEKIIAWHNAVFRGSNKRVLGTLSAGVDVTTMRLTEKALKSSEEKYRRLFEDSLEGIGISKGNRVVAANRALLKIFGYETLEEFANVPLLEHVSPEYRELIRERMKKREKNEYVASRFSYRILRKDGKFRDLEASTSEIFIDGEKYALTTFCDVTEYKKTEKTLEMANKQLLISNRKLQRLALKDPLTGLYNHRYFGDIIESEFYRAKRYAHPFSMILLDIDYFKSINDVYGYQFGDMILKQFAKKLRRLVRLHDHVIRYGDEEFIIILPGSDRAGTLHLSQRIFDSLRMFKFGDPEHAVKLKISMALVSYPEDPIFRNEDLLALADKILTRAKEEGGHKILSSIDINEKSHMARSGMANIRYLKNRLGKITRQINQNLGESIFAFAKTIELKDQFTGEHVEKTVFYATEIARQLRLEKTEILLIQQAAMLHDLGKIGISEKILLKRGKLTEVEFEQIKKHPKIGADILRPIQLLHGLIPLILYHHERWDGKGYPYGLKGNEIPLGARIIAIADVYHALVSDRPYRKALSEGKAITLIKENSGTQFDPEITEIFLKIVQKDKM